MVERAVGGSGELGVHVTSLGRRTFWSAPPSPDPAGYRTQSCATPMRGWVTKRYSASRKANVMFSWR